MSVDVFLRDKYIDNIVIFDWELKSFLREQYIVAFK